MDQKSLKEYLDYDEASGNFRWLRTNSNRAKVGNIAGAVRPDGYVVIRFNGKAFLAHRLAWFWMYGVWPENQIDHINRNRSDNRIDNLRDVLSRQNQQNMKITSKNTSGYVGVSRRKNGKWRASIMIKQKFISLGVFGTPEEASEAYQAAKLVHHDLICGDCDERMEGEV